MLQNLDNSMTACILNGLKNNEFKMYLQFIVDSKTQKIVSLAHSMGIATIVEGVETEEQNIFITESQCDFIQGWYYTKAMPLEKCEAFIEAYSAL